MKYVADFIFLFAALKIIGICADVVLTPDELMGSFLSGAIAVETILFTDWYLMVTNDAEI